MRKLMAAGVVAAGALGLSAGAGAAETVYEITGSFGANEHSCTQISHVLGGFDCSFGRNWPAAATEADGITPAWGGPIFGGGHYERGSLGDVLSYVPTTGAYVSGTTFSLAAPDGKYEAPITGTFTINDNNTPGNAADDRFSANFSIGAMARNFPTGQSSRALQRWDSMDHVMVATNVSAATPNGAGGVDYVIGSRGFPQPLCNRADGADCFPTPNSPNNATGDYDANELLVSFWTPIAQNSIGVERTGQLADPSWATANPRPPASPPTGNVGARTTATFTGYECLSTINGECTTNSIVWGGGEDPGFDNLVMRVSTDSSGAITNAQVYWTQEYFIGAFGGIAGYDNSVQYGSFEFAGSVQNLAPNARDFAATVIEDTASNILDTVANSVNFTGPITVSIVTPPGAGTASVGGDQRIIYNATGVGVGTQTIVYETTDGDATDQGTITVTVEADASPVAPDGGTIAIVTQGVAPASTIGTLNVSSLGGYQAGNSPATVTAVADVNDGTASVTGGTIVRFVPAANFFTGTAVFDYTVTDGNGDADSGEITVTIADANPILSDGTIPATDQDTQSPALTLSIVAGNGSVAQHTLAVTTQGASGTCDISGTQLRYTPDAEFFGDDSCVVTITDGDGDSDTAEFAVTVNEVDDALNLPGGGSAMDLWSLLLLGGAPLLRRRRRA